MDKHVKITAVFCTDGFEVIHCSDRKTGPHGCVLFAVKISSKLSVIDDQSVIFDFGSDIFVKLNNITLCETAICNPRHGSFYTLNGIIIEIFFCKLSKQLNVLMVESNLNTTHWILCSDLNVSLVGWNTLSSDDQRQSSFSKLIAKFNLGLLTDKDFS